MLEGNLRANSGKSQAQGHFPCSEHLSQLLFSLVTKYFFIMSGTPTYNVPTFLEVNCILHHRAELGKNTPFPNCRGKGPLLLCKYDSLIINKDCVLQFGLGEGLTLHSQLCLWSIISIRKLCRRWRHVPGKESICFHTKVISKGEMGKPREPGTGLCPYQICISVVKTVSHSQLFSCTLRQPFLSCTRVQKETWETGEGFRKWSVLSSASDSKCYFLVQKQQAWGK